MFQFILRRLTMVIPTFVGVSILTFSLIHMIPGNPVTVMGGERGFSAEQTAEITAMLGLDKPLWQQYFVYVGNVLQGNLGTSFITREPVLDEFLTLFPATIELSFFAALFALSIGLPLGIIAATKRGSFFDHSVMTISLTGYSMPIFWWGLLLILLVSINLDLTPVAGRIDQYQQLSRFQLKLQQEF